MQELPPLDQIKCTKPRKYDNTYVCQLFVGDAPTDNTKRKTLTLSFKGSKIIQMKHAFQPGDYTIYIKNRKMHDLLYDLNTFIVEYTRKHCSDWFGNNMNPELLEDYFSNPLFYMKNHGDIIKLKCVGSPNLNEFVEMDKPVDLEITIANIRFYKQKFMYECKVEACTESALDIKTIAIEDDVEDVDASDEEDIPQPTADEINILREEFKQILRNKRNKLVDREEELDSELTHVRSRVTAADKFLSILDKENINLEKILEIGDQLDDF